jgi:predicted NAD-dependent protein-ADP-ribosyltransferase YbiA (DUF1768 family)
MEDGILSARAAITQQILAALQATESDERQHEPRDDFWGWGSDRTGQNMLGKLWMEIRTELREEVK